MGRLAEGLGSRTSACRPAPRRPAPRRPAGRLLPSGRRLGWGRRVSTAAAPFCPTLCFSAPLARRHTHINPSQIILLPSQVTEANTDELTRLTGLDHAALEAGGFFNAPALMQGCTDGPAARPNQPGCGPTGQCGNYHEASSAGRGWERGRSWGSVVFMCWFRGQCGNYHEASPAGRAAG